MASNSKSAFVLVIFFVGVVMAANAGRVSPPSPSFTIVKACSIASDRDFCIGSLSSAPGVLKADMKELAVIAVNMSLNEAQPVYRYVVNLKKLERSSGALGDCEELFGDTVYELQRSLFSSKKLGKKGSDFEDEVDDVRTWLSGASTYIDTCYESLGEDRSIQQYTSLRIKRRSHYLSKLIDDALSVAAKLADKDDP